MSFRKQLLMGAVALAAMGSQAMAAQISNVTVGGQPVGTGTATYQLANEIVFGSATPTGTITFQLNPTTGALPSGNVLLDVSITGATFSTGLGGGAVTTVGCGSGFTSVISTGGAVGSGSVTFVLSGMQDCNSTTEGVSVTIPVLVAGSSSVGVTAGWRTEASVPVDQGPVSRAGIITPVSGFTPAVTADTASTQLTIASGFKQFTGDRVLGTVSVSTGTTTVYSNLAGAAVSTGSVGTGTVTVTGDFSGFGTATGQATLYLDANNNNVVDSGEAFSISGSTATRTGVAGSVLVAGAPIKILTQTGATAAVLNASAYSGTLTVGYTPSTTYKTATEAVTAALDSVTREGTTIVFPWVSSGTQALGTLSTNVIRIGNVSAQPITGLFVRVRNSSTGFTGSLSSVPAAAGTSTVLPAGGERVLTSAELESILGGNFGRGDLEFVVEAPASSVTARRFVFNGSSFTELSPGLVSQDQGGGT